MTSIENKRTKISKLSNHGAEPNVNLKKCTAIDVLMKILFFFEKERNWKILYRNNPIKRLSKATGINLASLYQIVQKYRFPHASVDAVVKSQHASKIKPVPVRRRKLDDFDVELVTRTIHDMYREGKPASSRSLQIALMGKGLDISKTVLRTLKRQGFRFHKNHDGRRFFEERQDVIDQRFQYLRKIRKFREQGHHIVYLDETWINTNHTVKGEWLEDNFASTTILEPICRTTGRFVPSGKGSRLIIVYAGSSQLGLIPDCSLVFESKTSSSDYHTEMNAECFNEWFRDIFLPKLHRSSVIVMDNASYHSQLDPQSRIPTTASRKAEVEAWLDSRRVHYEEGMCKAELLGLVKRNKPQPRYVIDDLAAQHGHEVLRLPPRHCELNPIELVWADIKGYVARNNTTFKKNRIIELYSQARQRIDRVQWAKIEQHVIREVEDSDSDDTDDDLASCDGNSTDEDELSDAISYESDHGEIHCSICYMREPPGLSSRVKNVSWRECQLCEKWVHDKCCKESKNKNLCDKCWAIIHNKNYET